MNGYFLAKFLRAGLKAKLKKISVPVRLFTMKLVISETRQVRPFRKRLPKKYKTDGNIFSFNIHD